MSFIDFVEGPLYYVAATIFVLGALWRVIGIIRIGRKKDISPPKGSAAMGFFKGNLRHFFRAGYLLAAHGCTSLAAMDFTLDCSACCCSPRRMLRLSVTGSPALAGQHYHAGVSSLPPRLLFWD